MTNTQAANLEPIPTDYDGLMKIHVLRPIHDKIELKNAAEIVDKLAVLDKRTEDQEDFLDALSTLIEAYEKKCMAKRLSKGGPIDALRFLLDEHEMSGSDLGRVLGCRTLGSAILNGTRRLSQTHIVTLAKYFSVNPSLFMAAWYRSSEAA